MAVVVNDEATVAKFFFFEAHTWFSERTETDPFFKRARIVDLQDAAAFGDDARCRRWINHQLVADFVGAAEDAIVRSRDRVHERSVVADDRTLHFIDLRNDRDLATVGFKIDIVHELARADSDAIDYEIEFRIDIFELVEANVRIDCAAGFLKTVREIIEIDGGVH